MEALAVVGRDEECRNVAHQIPHPEKTGGNFRAEGAGEGDGRGEVEAPPLSNNTDFRRATRKNPASIFAISPMCAPLGRVPQRPVANSMVSGWSLVQEGLLMMPDDQKNC